MIQFENVSKRYGGIKVLDSLNLSILRGELVAVIGASGAGKSTLIHALIGAERVQMGRISVDGYEVQKMNETSLQFFRRRVGVVFQDYKLLPQKNVYENVAFALEVCGSEDAEIRKRVPEVLHFVGLTAKVKQFPRQLSGGEKQRLAIARALVHNPGLIVADEPTGNLDPVTAREIIDLLMRINREGVTVILTTHNPSVVKQMNSRVVRIEKGKVVSDKEHDQYE